MIVFPKAKINIGLRITGKRPDGYHNIETVFYPVGLCDALELVVSSEPPKKDVLTITGINTRSNPEDNLITKTLKKIRERFSVPPLKIHLHKVIPVGAGLGGGSSDAIYFLKAVNKCFGLFMDKVNLRDTALEIGSDCSFFIDEIPSFATGRGEILQPVRPNLTGYYLLLLNPGIEINTREAYEDCQPEVPSTSLLQLINCPITDWKELIINDFESLILKRYSLIAEIKKELYRSGALFSLLSGSGSSVYAIFSEKPDLHRKLKEFVIYEGVI
jgi:4-diphosphocytidyl-2-C-methyl-D-erythritol kinase